MSTFVSRDFRRGGPKSREEYDVILKIDQDQHSMDAATSEYSVIVNRDGERVHVSPRRNKEGEWELDLYDDDDDDLFRTKRYSTHRET